MNIQNAAPAQHQSLLDWWMPKRVGFNATKRKGLDSAFMLISWKLWKERNDVFNRSSAKNVATLVQEISTEGELWCATGAKHLAAIGWPGTLATPGTAQLLSMHL